MKKITYAKVGDNYYTKDPIKKLAQVAAQKTAQNLAKSGFSEMTMTFAFIDLKSTRLSLTLISVFGYKK